LIINAEWGDLFAAFAEGRVPCALRFVALKIVASTGLVWPTGHIPVAPLPACIVGGVDIILFLDRKPQRAAQAWRVRPRKN